MLRVGFGVSALCKGIAAGGSDGIGRYTLEMLRHLNKNQDLTLIPFSFGLPVAREILNELTTGEPNYRANTIQLSGYPMNALWASATGLDFFGAGRLCKALDVIHAPDHYIPKYSAVPLVATLMDAIPLSHPEWSRDKHRGLKNELWVRAASWADQIITISEFSKAEIVKWAGINRNKISVIPLGVDQGWFRAVAAEEFTRVRVRYNLPDRFFLSIGTLQPRKNIDGAIWAHRAMPIAERKRTPLIIVGRAGWKCNNILKMIEQDSPAGMVRWLKVVPDTDLLAVVKSAKALVFASLAEGFGLPVLEAFAAQTPVITSNTTSLLEVAGDAALTINPSDIAALSQAMTRLSNDEALANKLKQRGLVRATSYTWQACAQATLSVYSRLGTG